MTSVTMMAVTFTATVALTMIVIIISIITTVFYYLLLVTHCFVGYCFLLFTFYIVLLT